MVDIQKQSFSAATGHEQSPARAVVTQARLHLPFLDGLRGLAAFYVLLFHVVANGHPQLVAGTFLINFLRFGREAVVVFIVLSGFVIALPVCRSPQVALAGGRTGFLKRRARRLLPAYYAALLLLPLYLLGVESVKHLTGAGADWHRIADLFISPAMISHLFLLHNLSPEWVLAINPVLWSLATEWWIYVVFALVLLPTWRRFGVRQAAWLSLGLGLIPTTLLLQGWPTLSGGPHLLGAFGLGMLSAALLFEVRSAAQLAAWRTGLIGVAILAASAFWALVVYVPTMRFQEETIWVLDLLSAVVSAAIIWLIASARLHKTRPSKWITGVSRLLESRPLVTMGRFSYSIYLTHLVVWAMLGITLNAEPVQQVLTFSLHSLPMRILVLIPLLLVSAYGFYLLFEKPFLNQRR